MNFDYKKHGKIMVNITITIITICLTIWFFSLILLFFYRPIYTPAAYNTKDILVLKTYLAENIDKDKNTIFIVSGSNSHVGIHSKILINNFDYNIVNMAISFGLPISFILNSLKKYLKDGDIIICPLELEYPNNNHNLTEWQYNLFSTCLVEYKHLLPIETQKQLLLKNIKTYWSRIPNIFKPLPLKTYEKILSESNCKIFSKNMGDVNQFAEAFIDYTGIDDNRNYHAPNIPQKASKQFINDIKEFNDYCKKNNIGLYFTYPTIIKQIKFDTSDEETMIKYKKYREIFKNVNINFFGTANFYNLDAIYFYDTFYHLNATGAVLRSMLLAEDIKTYILGQKPSYEAGKEQEFFEQKEKEALEYMEMLREQEKEALEYIEMLREQEKSNRNN